MTKRPSTRPAFARAGPQVQPSGLLGPALPPSGDAAAQQVPPPPPHPPLLDVKLQEAKDMKEYLEGKVTVDEDRYVFACPHCGTLVQVRKSEIACKIFRHAHFKATGQMIGPHTDRKTCESLVAQNLVHGCAKPFRFDGTGPASKCDYI